MKVFVQWMHVNSNYTMTLTFIGKYFHHMKRKPHALIVFKTHRTLTLYNIIRGEEEFYPNLPLPRF